MLTWPFEYFQASFLKQPINNPIKCQKCSQRSATITIWALKKKYHEFATYFTANRDKK